MSTSFINITRTGANASFTVQVSGKTITTLNAAGITISTTGEPITPDPTISTAAGGGLVNLSKLYGSEAYTVTFTNVSYGGSPTDGTVNGIVTIPALPRITAIPTSTTTSISFATNVPNGTTVFITPQISSSATYIVSDGVINVTGLSPGSTYFNVVFSANNYSNSAPQNVTTNNGNFTTSTQVVSSTAINVTLASIGDGIPSSPFCIIKDSNGETLPLPNTFANNTFSYTGLSANTIYSFHISGSSYNPATSTATTNKTFTAAQTSASLTSATITLTAGAGTLPGVVTVVRNGVTDNVGVSPSTGSVPLWNITGTHNAVISAFGYDSVTVPNVYVQQRLTKPTPTVSAVALGELIVSGYADSNATYYNILVEYEGGIQAASTGTNGTTLTSYTFSNLGDGIMYRVTVMARSAGSGGLYYDSEDSEYVYKRTLSPFNISVSSSTSTSITYSLNGSIPSSGISFSGLTNNATASYTAGTNTFTINGLLPGSSPTITLSATDFISADTPPATTKSANTNATIKINNITATGSPLTVTVPNGTTLIDVAAELEDPNAVVSFGTGVGITFTAGMQRTITVQAEDRAVAQNYVVIVNEAPAAASSDNTLSSAGISCNGVLLVDGATTDIPFSATGYTVAATPNNAGATISGTGSKSLVFGTNTISVTVTQNGSPATYTRTVNVVSSGNSADTSLATFTIGGVDMMGLTSYEFPYNTPDTIPVSVTLANNATFGTAPSLSIAFPVGASVAVAISFTVVSQDGSALTSYYISVTRATPSNNTTATFTVGGSDVVNGGTISRPAGTISVAVEVFPGDSNATYEVTGNSGLVTGQNTVTIVVTAEDGTTKSTYRVYVDVAANTPTQSPTKLVTPAVVLSVSTTTSGTLVVSWDAVSNAADYGVRIYKEGETPDVYHIVNTTRLETSDPTMSYNYSANKFTITFSDLDIGATYYAAVKANSLEGDNFYIESDEAVSQPAVVSTISGGPGGGGGGGGGGVQISSDKSLSVFTINGMDVVDNGSISLPHGTTTISVIATPTASSATAALTAPSGASLGSSVPVQNGANTITVRVTAEDGSPRDYTVIATVMILKPMTLSFVSATQTSLVFTLSASPVPLTPNFSANGVLQSQIAYANGTVTITGLTAGTSYTLQAIDVDYTHASATRSTEAAPAPAPSQAPVCFLADAPVLTPSGYRAISTIKMGDKVLTADGRLVTVRSTYAKRYLASAATNPYVIPKGTFGATESLPISPNHEVKVPGRGMIKAKHLGLRQMTMKKTFTYYNLELDDWVCDNMTVAGVEVESLAPTKRITMSRDEYADFVYNRYGTPTADTLARIKQVFYRLEDGRVSAPIFASK